MAIKSTKRSSASTEVEALRRQIAELQEKLKMDTYEDELQEEKIQQDEYISVMSLLPYNLNLSTKEAGQGNTKKFTKFGEVKRILYKDLVDILEVHKNFMESGYFYIMHPAFIRQQGLNEAYSKILTKEKIEEILLANSEDCVKLYISANENQQEVIIRLLVEKVRDNPKAVNLNMIDRISRISKIDIMKRAEEMIEREPESAAEEKE